MWDDESPQGHEPKEECLMVNIITVREEIGKFFTGMGSEKIEQRTAEQACRYHMWSRHERDSSKTTDFAEIKQGNRITYGQFLSKDKWDEQEISQKQQEKALRKATELALAKGEPVCLSIDDTVIEKKKPSSGGPNGPWREAAGTILIWRRNRSFVLVILLILKLYHIFHVLQ